METMQTPPWAPQSPDSTLLDLRDYWSVLKRRRRLIAVVALAAVAASVLYTFTRTKVYSATAEVLVKPAITGGATLGVPPTVNVENEREILLSVPVAALAGAKLSAQPGARATDPTKLLRAVDVTSPKDADVLQVRFSDPDPSAAAAGAQAFAQAYLDYKRSQADDALSAEASVLENEINQAAASPGGGASVAALRAQLAIVKTTVVDPGSILIPASVPGRPSSPNLVMNLALALFCGLFVGVVAAYVRERMDDHLRGRTDLEDTLGVPVMTMIPTVPSWRERSLAHLVTLEAPRSAAAEAYRTLRTSVLVAAAERGVRTIMVVSAVAGEGKSTTAANLAAVLAQADKRVVLVSADLRRPRAHEFFGLTSERGLSDVLRGDRRGWESLRSGRIDNLWVMSSGRVSERPTELLQSPAMRELIAEQRDMVDFVVVDCPPVLAVADALVLAPLVDAVLYVADAATTPRGAVLQARAQLDQVGARIVGAVLNNADAGAGYAYYGAEYGYASGMNSASSVSLGGQLAGAGSRRSSVVSSAIGHLRKDRAGD
jgi:capsular exopolysaccharide synthesis family protein